MKFGVQVNVYRTDWSSVKASVTAMENGSWDSLWFQITIFRRVQTAPRKR